MKEFWKPIKGYETCYEISSLGRVRNLVRYNQSKSIIMKRIINKGYNKLRLSKQHHYKWFNISKLVAQNFIPNPLNKPQVNHINGIKTDDRLNNLEWATNSENQLHAYRTGLQKLTPKRLNHLRTIGIGKKWSKNTYLKNCRPVYQYSFNNKFIKKWSSLSEAGRTLKISKHNIWSCCNKKLNSTGGFIWRYVNEKEKNS